MIPEGVDPATAELLERFGFSEIPFARLRERVASGELTVAHNVVRGTVEPPTDDDLTPLPEPDTDAFERARELGATALAEGKIGAVVLAGGMATRFGGVVKGIVEVLDGRSFLDLKLSDIARAGPVPVALMTSFATDEVTREHVARLDVPEPLWFSQFVSLRLTPGGDLFREDDGKVSPYGPGHGDLFDAITGSGTLAALQARGVEHVVVSNVDNLMARIDPVVIGAHLLAGRPLTMEVAPKDGDVGGAPVRVDGRLQILEGPRFPASFDHDTVRVFNTNTAVISVSALGDPTEPTWLTVEKEVAGDTAIQLERVYHELTAHVPTTMLVVPRDGPRGRFAPVKVPDDLPRVREDVRRAFGL